MFKHTVKPRPQRSKRLFAAGLVMAMVSILGVAVILRQTPNKSNSATAVAVQHKGDSTSLFSFDHSRAPDWKQGPTNETSMAVFYSKGDCFIIASKSEGQLDETDQQAKALATMQQISSSQVDVKVVSQGLQTTSGKVNYSLHQYRARNSQGGDYYPGQAAGFIKSNNSYVSLSANCKNVADLDLVTTAFAAVTVVM